MFHCWADWWFKQPTKGAQKSYATCCQTIKDRKISPRQEEKTKASRQKLPRKESLEIISGPWVLTSVFFFFFVLSFLSPVYFKIANIYVERKPWKGIIFRRITAFLSQVDYPSFGFNVLTG